MVAVTLGRFGLIFALVFALFPASACGSVPEGLEKEVKTSIASGTQPFDNAALDTLLPHLVEDGWVDYPEVADQRDRLEAYLSDVASANVASLDSDHLKALRSVEEDTETKFLVGQTSQ